MRKIFLLFLILSPVFLTAGNSGFYSYRVAQDSWVSIHGATNINTFRCDSREYISRGYLIADYDMKKEALYFSDAKLKLPVSSFDCGNRRMNRDFIEALGGQLHPEITISLLETYYSESPIGMSKGLMAVLEINLNGVRKQTVIPVALTGFEDFRFHIKGKKTLRMSDFDIDPPSPALGLVRVDDSMDIEFNLIIEANMLSEF